MIATNYVKNWIKAKSILKNDAHATTMFFYENILTRYEILIDIVSDRGKHFLIKTKLDEFMVIHKRSAPYHAQANGLAGSTNKTLCTELTKVVSNSRFDWADRLHGVLWAYRIAYKTDVGATPFELGFGLNAILPIEFLVPTLKVAKELNWTGHDVLLQAKVPTRDI